MSTLDDHIDGFIAAFRAEQRPFRAGTEPCIVQGCADWAVTYCESCRSALCQDHADFTTYDDVDMCADKNGCEKRLEKHAEQDSA